MKDKNEDVQLINRFLDGDESAFTILVRKYQKGIHALAWRKVDDFHIAEELTQDAFLKAYEKLATLKNPSQFAGWLYVITDRLCIAWHRKQRPQMESLETTSMKEIEELSYRSFEDEQLKEASVEFRRSVIKNLLEELPESERTVVTLHYLGEMKCKAIGEFLGISVNTVKSRLQRARNRLKEQEDIIREILGGVQLPVNFTENIMQQVAEIKPLTPVSSEPIVPWAAAAATGILIFLIIGTGSQYLARFQQPYNIDAQSETTVEIIDAPIVLDTQAKRDLRNQSGRFNTANGSTTSLQASEAVAPAAITQVDRGQNIALKQQWLEANGPKGGKILGLLRTPEGEVYSATSEGIYRLEPNASMWTLVNTSVLATSLEGLNEYNWVPMAEKNSTLYLASAHEVFASSDRGETWKSLGEHPKGRAIGLAITDDALYLALEDEGIFRSTDSSKQWDLLNNEAAGIRTLAVATIENTVFVGTTEGLYRINSGTLKKLSVDTTKAIHSLAVSENNIYVGTGLISSHLETPEGKAAYARQLMSNDNSSSWEIFHSTDLGNSWTEITPTSSSFLMKISPSIKVLASGKTVLALGGTGFRFRSTDSGKTWIELGVDTFDIKSMLNSMMLGIFPAVAINANTFLQTGALGMTHSTDAGETWQPFMKGMIGTSILNVVVFKNTLYTNTGFGIAKSIDSGESWQNLRMDFNESIRTSTEKAVPNDLLFSPKLALSGNALYCIGLTLKTEDPLRIFRLAADGNTLVPIQQIPSFVGHRPIENPKTASQKMGEEKITNDARVVSAFAVSSEAFYIEYRRRLFRWRPGEQEWFNTGLIDTSESSNHKKIKGFTLAVSREIVYVGKSDGRLFQSTDAGDTWKDITVNLPLRFERFNEIMFNGSTVYIATDRGVLASKGDGRWRIITDTSGTCTIIDRMVVADTTVYGVGENGAYRFNKNKWEQVLPVVPNDIIAISINGNRLYTATKERGLFYASLEQEQ